MKYEKYTSLIKELEEYAGKNPKGYELRVKGLVALGYGYFFSLFFIFIILPVLLVGLVIAVPQLAIALAKIGFKLILLVIVAVFGFLKIFWDLIRSIWTKIPAPEGYELNRNEVPKLFEMVEKTSDFLKSPRPNHILLIEDFNAAVVTLPRFGIFGKRTYLLIGLPLMQAISPAQLEAVLAHEIGHISEKHSSSAALAYRLRETWGRFIESQELEGHKLSFLYDKFLNWYFPYFNAYSFVLLRRQEREADEYAVQLAGAKPLGEALINLEIKSRGLAEKFWKEVLNEAAREKTPPKELFTQMALAFRESNKSQDLMNLSKAVAINTDYADSHPSLAERLKTIGYWKNTDFPDLPEEVSETASQHYFSDLENKFSAHFNSVWQERVKGEWQKRHDFLLEVQKRINELDEKEKSETLAVGELYERAALIAEKYGAKEALPYLRRILETYPDHADSNFGVGTILLDEDDKNGIGFIEKATASDRSLKIAGYETIYYYLRSKGRDEDAKKYVLAIENEQEVFDLAQKERSQILPTDNFGKHDISEEVLDKIRNRIQYYDEIQAAYLVRKEVDYYSEFPVYVMFFDMTSKKNMFSGAGLNKNELLDAMVERLGEYGIHYFVVLDSDFESVRPKLAQIDNAKMFQR